MGLDTTHNCWHGAYSSFHRWRRAVAAAAGIDLNDMQGFGGNTAWSSLKPDPLHVLLSHSDCDGEIAAEDCEPLAESLKKLLPRLQEDDKERAITFISGLRIAASRDEDVEFR